MTVFIISTMVAVVVSFLCSLAEAVLLSLNVIRLETMKEQGKAHAAHWLNMKKDVGRPIAAILILNTIAHTGGATVAGGAFENLYGSDMVWVFSTSLTVVILFGTEIIPKVLGVSFNERLARYVAPPLRATMKALAPLIALTELVSNIIRKRGDKPRMQIRDIQSLARVARTQRLIDVQQEQIILNVTRMRRTTAGEISIPAQKAIVLDTNAPMPDLLAAIRETMHTRYPVSPGGALGDVIGYVNVKEITTTDAPLDDLELSDYIRDSMIVDSSQNLNHLLKELIENRIHIAFVQNQDGEVQGMVTLEDVLEEIVGEIEDEFH